MRKHNIFKKNRFPLLKRHLYQNGKAENMLVVASRLVSSQLKLKLMRKDSEAKVWEDT